MSTEHQSSNTASVAHTIPPSQAGEQEGTQSAVSLGHGGSGRESIEWDSALSGGGKTTETSAFGEQDEVMRSLKHPRSDTPPPGTAKKVKTERSDSAAGDLQNISAEADPNPDEQSQVQQTTPSKPRYVCYTCSTQLNAAYLYDFYERVKLREPMLCWIKGHSMKPCRKNGTVLKNQTIWQLKE